MIKIDTEFITLGQLLKMTDWISSGGEAKLAVKELKITVNGKKERPARPPSSIRVIKSVLRISAIRSNDEDQSDPPEEFQKL